MDQELDQLRTLSAEIGSDPSLVQAAGGNTSLKRDGTMWIKASGTWLAQARERDIMVPVDIAALRQALARNDPACDNCLAFVRPELNRHGLRPSIETSVHAVMAQRVVVHVHCVETIAWAVQRQAERQLAGLLDAFRWAFIPYRKPGLSLSQAIAERLGPETDVLVLGNHGLVVAAGSVPEVEVLLRRVVVALRRPVRAPPPPGLAALERLAAGTPYRLPVDAAIHGTASDPLGLAHARTGTLYPDHLVFLGPGVTVIAPDARFPEEPDLPPLLLVAGKGALIRKGAVAAVEPMARCLADVTARLEPHDSIIALTPAEEAELADWDAEKYRQSLAKPAVATD